jgi:hypothetical protein
MLSGVLSKLNGYAKIGLISVAIALPMLPLSAQETTTFEYDALGRLISTQKAGGPKSGETTSSAYDPAGNRAGYAVNAQAPGPSTSSTFSISGGGAINEGQTISLLISRGGISHNNAASVNYATTDGTGTAPSDYAGQSETLYFAAFELAKSITISTSVDSLAEPAETFAVSLSNPSAGSFIGNSTAAITINASSVPNLPPATQPAAVSVALSCDGIGSTTTTITASDPENNLPMAIIAGSSGTVADIAPAGGLLLNVSGHAPGTEQLIFTIADSLGATALGAITVTAVSVSGCNNRVGSGG